MMNIVNSSPSKVNNTNIWGVNSLSQSPHHQHHLSSPLLSRLEDSKTISHEQHYDRNSMLEMDQAVLASNGNNAIGMDLLREIDQNENDQSSPPQHLDSEEFMIRSPIHKSRKSMGNSSGKSNQQILGTPVHHQQHHPMGMTSPQQNSTSPMLLSSPPMHIANNTWMNEKMFLESKIARLSSDLYSAKCEIARLQNQLEEYRQKEMHNTKVNSTSTVGNSPSPTEMMMNGSTNVGLERPLSPASSCTTSSWTGYNNDPIGSTFPGPEKSSPYENSIYSYMTNPAQQLLISPRKSPTPNNVTTTPGRYNRSNSFGSSGNDLPNTNLMQNNRLSVLATPNRGVNNSNGLSSINDPLFPQNINDYQMSPNRIQMINPIGMDSPIMMTPTSGNSGSRKYSTNNVLVNSPFITPNIGSGRIFPTPTTPSPNNLYYNSSIAITPKSTTSSVASNSSASSGTPTLSDASNGTLPSSLIKPSSPVLSTTPTSTGGGASSNSTTSVPVINHNKTGGEIVYLLSGGGVGSIKVYDLSKDEFTQAQDNQQQHAKRGYDKHALTDYYLSLKGHSRFVSALHSHQGRICSGSGDNSIRIWNFDTGECEHVLAGCEGKVGALCSYYGNLVSGSKDGNSHRIRAWDVEKAECVKCVHAHSDWINVLCASDNTLFSGSGDRKVKVWSGPNFENIMTLDNSSFVLSLVYDPVYNCLVAGTYDGHIRIWDIRSGTKFIKQIKAHSNGVLSLCYHAGLLCSGSKDQTISIYDPKTWNRESQLIGHTDAVKCLVSYQNTWLCSGSYDRTVKLWNLDTANRGSYCTIATGFKNYTLTCHTA
ncbi:predicted protein [Naegleria gruberi]|uniref:Predicted protein n=1 Tax=Naegleria gruberi TaxID=5762 RepID=D2VKK5_NAEGR|nr:uncharacterized protein NAEGRDRAFT_80320 [Naegleria gruberi]EFC42706.1 predicted protein [Naegleria gruberi]|eukprot:XP_002675450.1 predicted protein [Naegleria gruberi strain NEG-M]